MNALKKFSFDDAVIRVELDEAGRPWWVLADVCDALGIRNASDVAGRLDDDEKGLGKTDTPGGAQQALLVSEAGLYRVIFRSNKSEANRFQRWVFHEVLPTIRQTGKYEAAPERTPVERETRYPDGRVVFERFGAVTPAQPQRRELPAPVVDTSLLRRRFFDALSAELKRLPKYEAMDRDERGFFKHALNSRMKAIVGAPREEWQPRHYETAADWLFMWEGLDIRWALAPVGDV